LIGVAALCAVSANGSAAHAGPEFLTYEGRNAVQEGQGGERKTVDGIDFWMTGNPPRRFQILGSLNDRRHQSGLIGMARMSALDGDIAKATKAAGGDAVILQSEDTDVIGAANFASTNVSGYAGGNRFGGNAYTASGSHLIRKHDSRWLVIRYLPDDVAVPAPGVTTSAAPPSPGDPN
jgi:hypothetical protein